ncbi:MAG: integrin alpha [Candidatus Thalassarchaeaceae archaeon]|nr:integrin alpha [Candidatus Thalassarchaeaceae archaeon]
MIFASLTPFAVQEALKTPALQQEEAIASSVTFTNGSGDQFAGQTVVINGSDWLVDPNRGMDVWHTTALNTSLTFDEISLTRDDRGRARGCMHESTGGIWLAKLEFGGGTSLTQVESGGAGLGEKCSIAVDEREKLHIAYTNESGFLRIAYQRVSGAWNIRTIENQSTVTQINLLLDSEGDHNILWLDSNNSLHFSTYTTWWTHTDLLAGTRVSEGFDAYLDDDDSLNIFYRNLDSMQMIHGILDTDGNWLLSALTAGADIGPAMTFAKDPSTGNIQYAYATSSSSTLTVVRDLSGQENGRISPSVQTIATGAIADEYASQAFNDLDFDCDGIDDLIVSKQEANSSIGAVEIFWGSSMGLSPVADFVMTGSAGGDRFGSSIANAGDVNGDGCEDLLVGSTGAVDNLGYATGKASIYFGGNHSHASADWTVEGENSGDKFGGTVSSAGDIDNDGFDDVLVAATGFTQSGGEGKVYLYLGSSSGPSTSSSWTTRGYWQNVIQGWSLAGIGDINGDGCDDIAIGAAGSFSELTGNGRVEVYVGSGMGWMTIDNYWTTSTTNTLLGYSVAGIGDVNGDGYDDFAFSEPLYDNSALGKVSVLLGDSTGLPDDAELELVGTQSSQMFGSDVSTIGDINDDGVEEIAISSIGLGTSPGKVEYFFADDTEYLRRGANSLLATGVSGQHLGRTVGGGGDLDGDGQLEIIITSLDKDMEGNSVGAVVQIEKLNNDISDILMPTTMLDLDLDDLGRFHLFVGGNGQTHHLERPNAATDSTESWEVKTFDTTISSMVVTRAGKAIILDDSNTFTDQNAHTQLSLVHPVLSNAIHDLDLEIIDDQSHIFYTEEHNASTAYANIRAETDSDFITSSLGNNSTSILSFNSTSAITGIDVGSSCTFSNGSVALISNVGNKAAVTYYEGNNSSTYTLLNDAALSVDSACRHSNSLLVAIQTATSYELLEFNNSVNSLVSGSASVTSAEALIVDASEGTALFADASGGHLLCDSSNSCSAITGLASGATIQAAATGGDDAAWLLHDGGNNVATLSLLEGLVVRDVWTYSSTATALLTHADMEVDSDGIVRIVVAEADGQTSHMTSFRVFSDWDRDFVPAPWDDVEMVGGQWSDSDSDGYGDNPDGPVPDSCTSSGTGPFDRGSKWGLFGCSDADWDGWADSIDNCLNDQGDSWIDVRGCPDPDGDGWSSSGIWTTTPDQDPLNWYQQRDTDADGHLDNHGPDCCGLDASIDIYPLNGNQWEDEDVDGWGDNRDFEYANVSLRTSNGVDLDNDGSNDYWYIDWSGDQCPGVQGFSRFDRGGCPDTDSDGWSDPHIAENQNEASWLYNRSECHDLQSEGHYGCADNWPGGGNTGEPCADLTNCSQQWHDKDGDGYGDNSTIGAWLQDAFNEDPTQWNDTDFDGYGDNQNGTTPDDCPVIWGNSTVDRLGCPDSDGDEYSNPDASSPAHPTGNADSNSSNSEQWRDTDGDGFGDFTNKTNGDYCPNQYGYLNGDGGRGCPLPAEDADGDGIIDEEDVCANTTIGESVDTEGPLKGCSENQKDDDNDGVMNANDNCANTTAGATVDENGCSSDQLTLDDDNDGVPNISDECPGTNAGANVSTVGCALYQLDDDNDGVSNDVDMCPDTAAGAVVDEVGCPRSDMDSDGDGYDDSTDAFPLEASQWGDYDGDGFGDNTSGFQGDSCPTEPGNSSSHPNGDRWGCVDTDGDGFSDPTSGWGVEDGADAFINQSSQWKDTDGDGFGDNQTGYQGDECPLTPGVLNGVLGIGCAAATDGSGNQVDDCDKWGPFYDPASNPGVSVPEEFHNCAWYDEWYSVEVADEGLPMTMIAGVVGALLLLLIIALVSVRIIRGGDDWDEDDDELFDDDDWEEEQDIFSPGPASRGDTWSAPAATQDFSGRGGGPPSRGGPASSPPGRGGGPPSRGGGGPPSRGGGPPSRGGGGGPPRRGPSGPSRSSSPPVKATRRKVVSDGTESDSKPATRKTRKVVGGSEPPKNVKTRSTRKTRSTKGADKSAAMVAVPTETWEDLFTARDSANYEKSLGETRAAMASGETERNLLRKLQTEGWNAKQSRYIINES